MNQQVYISNAYVSDKLGFVESQELPNGQKATILEGEFSRANHKNRNNRYYPSEILSREVFRLEEGIQTQKGIPSQLDHPLPGKDQKDIARAQRNSLADACGIISHLEMNGDIVYGKLRVLDEGIHGTQLKAVLKTGFRVGISSRALGSQPIQEGEYLRVPDDIKFITFDVVSTPSNHESILNEMIAEEFAMIKEQAKEIEQNRKKIFPVLIELSNKYL